MLLLQDSGHISSSVKEEGVPKRFSQEQVAQDSWWGKFLEKLPFLYTTELYTSYLRYLHETQPSYDVPFYIFEKALSILVAKGVLHRSGLLSDPMWGSAAIPHNLALSAPAVLLLQKLSEGPKFVSEVLPEIRRKFNYTCKKASNLLHSILNKKGFVRRDTFGWELTAKGVEALAIYRPIDTEIFPDTTLDEMSLVSLEYLDSKGIAIRLKEICDYIYQKFTFKDGPSEKTYDRIRKRIQRFRLGGVVQRSTFGMYQITEFGRHLLVRNKNKNTPPKKGIHEMKTESVGKVPPQLPKDAPFELSYKFDSLAKIILKYLFCCQDEAPVSLRQIREYLTVKFLEPPRTPDWFTDRVRGRIRRFLQLRYVEKTSLGFYQITPEGRKFLLEGCDKVTFAFKKGTGTEFDLGDSDVEHIKEVVADVMEVEDVMEIEEVMETETETETALPDVSKVERALEIISLLTGQNKETVVGKLVFAEFKRLGIPDLAN